MPATTIKFETGYIYGCRSVCDYDCIFQFTVERRTANSVWLRGSDGKTTRRMIRFNGLVEQCYPLGSYSMAPVLDAVRGAKLGEA